MCLSALLYLFHCHSQLLYSPSAIISFSNLYQDLVHAVNDLYLDLRQVFTVAGYLHVSNRAQRCGADTTQCKEVVVVVEGGVSNEQEFQSVHGGV